MASGSVANQYPHTVTIKNSINATAVKVNMFVHALIGIGSVTVKYDNGESHYGSTYNFMFWNGEVTHIFDSKINLVSVKLKAASDQGGTYSIHLYGKNKN